MSVRDLCADCGARRASEQHDQIVAGQGPHYDEYVRGMRAYVRTLQPSD